MRARQATLPGTRLREPGRAESRVAGNSGSEFPRFRETGRNDRSNQLAEVSGPTGGLQSIEREAFHLACIEMT